MGWSWRFLAWLVLGAVCAGAQEQPADQPQEPIHTLHVYMDLIQVPVLVLDSDRERMRPIKPESFSISLDGGPEFHAKNVRQEGEDPISLGILLDLNSGHELIPRMSDAIAGLVPKSLHPQDHVTLYALDCGLFRTLEDVHADPARLKSGVDRALAKWYEKRRMKPPPECAKPVYLWDAMALALAEMAQLPGRRVMLVESNGSDGGSTHTQDQLRLFAQIRGISIFGYREGHSRTTEVYTSRGRGGFGIPGPTVSAVDEDSFKALCELSGGMEMSADSQFVGRELARFIAFVRERYILEFSRPRHGEPGEHNIAVTLPRAAPKAFIRSAGVSILNRDTSKGDEMTIPTDESGAPIYGTKKKPPPPSE